MTDYFDTQVHVLTKK